MKHSDNIGFYLKELNIAVKEAAKMLDKGEVEYLPYIQNKMTSLQNAIGLAIQTEYEKQGLHLIDDKLREVLGEELEEELEF